MQLQNRIKTEVHISLPAKGAHDCGPSIPYFSVTVYYFLLPYILRSFLQTMDVGVAMGGDELLLPSSTPSAATSTSSSSSVLPHSHPQTALLHSRLLLVLPTAHLKRSYRDTNLGLQQLVGRVRQLASGGGGCCTELAPLGQG